MGHHYFKSEDGSIQGHISFIDIYYFEGLTFEYHSYLGAIQYKKDLSRPRKNISKNFWHVVSKFIKLTKSERQEYLVYG